MERYQYLAEIDRGRSRHRTAREMSFQRISNSLTHVAVTWEETCSNLAAEMQGLSEVSNYLEDGDERIECKWYKANEERNKQKGIQAHLFPSLYGSDPITETTIIHSQLIDLVRISDCSSKLSSY